MTNTNKSKYILVIATVLLISGIAYYAPIGISTSHFQKALFRYTKGMVNNPLDYSCSISAASLSGDIPLTVTFNLTANIPSGCKPNTFSWNGPCGLTVSGGNCDYQYKTAGIYGPYSGAMQTYAEGGETGACGPDLLFSCDATPQIYVTSPTVPPPVINSFSASPGGILRRGQSATLSWSTQNAISCSGNCVSGDCTEWNGTKATSGFQAVTPTITSVYQLSCRGLGGQAQRDTRIYVQTSQWKEIIPRLFPFVNRQFSATD